MKRFTIYFCLLLSSGCATLGTPAVKTAEQIADELCHAYAAANPDKPIDAALCSLADDIVNLTLAKPSLAAAKEALVAHPPILPATVLPCIAPVEPQSRIDRKLYPMRIVEPPGPGE